MHSSRPKENSVHFPADRRPGLWIRPELLVGLLVLAALPIIIAWIQYGLFGLPAVADPVRTFSGSSGFPLWLRTAHYISFVLTLLLIRSGLSILADHPRLYRDRDCTPNSEWIRFTPLTVPTDTDSEKSVILCLSDTLNSSTKPMTSGSSTSAVPVL